MKQTLLLLPLALILAAPAVAGPKAAGKAKAAQKACIANLKQLNAAKEQYAMDHKKKRGDSVSTSDLVGTDKYLKEMPQCPSGGTYRLAKIGRPPACSVAGHSLPVLRGKVR